MDLSNSVLIITLAIATLVMALAYAIYQRRRAHQAKQRHEHSAIMDDPRFVQPKGQPNDR